MFPTCDTKVPKNSTLCLDFLNRQGSIKIIKKSNFDQKSLRLRCKVNKHTHKSIYKPCVKTDKMTECHMYDPPLGDP